MPSVIDAPELIESVETHELTIAPPQPRTDRPGFWRTLARGIQAFAGVENLFNVEYDTGRTPLRAIGWPRTLHAGVRVFLP